VQHRWSDIRENDATGSGVIGEFHYTIPCHWPFPGIDLENVETFVATGPALGDLLG
jgi:hypothetical protein